MERDWNGTTDLSPALYSHLQRIARAYLRRERQGHTYQPHDLVHEAIIRLLVGVDRFTDRQHFIAICARQMRYLLINHAKAKLCKKRDGISLDSITSIENLETADSSLTALVEIEDLLARLERRDPETAQVLELHYFGGLTLDETASELGISESTVTRKLRFARAWMQVQLGGVCERTGSFDQMYCKPPRETQLTACSASERSL